MAKVPEIVDKLKEEINGMNRKGEISKLENHLINNVEELSKNEKFFKLPLNNIK